jgi:hypothetical protein
MSSYTDALLICNDGLHISELNSILRVCDISTFERLGNSEFFEMSDNYLNLSELTDAINSIQWDARTIQLFVRDEHDDKFTEIALHPNQLPPLVELFVSDGEHDNNNVLIGEWKFERDKSKIFRPAIEVAQSICSDSDVLPLVVHAIVTSRISRKAFDEFVTGLFKDERAALQPYMSRFTWVN